ncbi:uncharacterized protein [Populus alba]|uniref:uncharacterized protein n=1 Tax=Populus alba TaxID=43335 RepID=UPI00158CB023|nr:long-chain-fatty-acid--AMP ligase FadD28-like [Populus alba]
MNYENYDPSFPDQPVVDLYLPLWANLPSFRSKPAFIWAEDGSNGATKNSTITYAQLNESVHSISTQLLTQLQRGDTVVILRSPGLELVEIIFGCQRAGLLCIPVFPPDPSFTKENYHHLVRVLSQTKPKAAITHHDYIARVQRYISLSSDNHKLAEMLQKLTWISTSDIKDKKVSSNMGSLPYKSCRPNELYLIQYTSGATGIPKPVLVTAGAAAHNVRVARKAYDLYPSSVIVSWLPQYHDCGLQFLLLTIISGATIPSFSLPFVIKRGGVDKGTQPISLWSLKNLIIINEPIYKASHGEATAAMLLAFHTTSSCHVQGLLCPREEEEDMDIIVVDEETCELVVDGTEGEIWVSSPSNCSGYLGYPSLTREIFQARLRNKVSRCFVRTGDRGIVKGEVALLHLRCQALYIVLVAEIQRHEKDVKVLKQICEWAKKAVLKEEKVEIGLMVLVESGSVPKTTSGKIQRWAAKDILIRGKMSVVMEMQFEDNNARFLPSYEAIGKANKEIRCQGGNRTSTVAGDI